VAVPVNGAFGFFEDREQTCGQRLQSSSFDRLKTFAYLLARGSVNALVGRRGLPLAQEKILRRQTVEAAAFDGIVLRVLHRRFHLALVPRHGGFGGQDHRPVMPCELFELGIELRIIPVGLDHSGF
jgi:hypothetical protein